MPCLQTASSYWSWLMFSSSYLPYGKKKNNLWPTAYELLFAIHTLNAFLLLARFQPVWGVSGLNKNKKCEETWLGHNCWTQKKTHVFYFSWKQKVPVFEEKYWLFLAIAVSNHLSQFKTYCIWSITSFSRILRISQAATAFFTAQASKRQPIRKNLHLIIYFHS